MKLVQLTLDMELLIGIVGAVLGIAGLILALRSRERKVPRFYARSTPLLDRTGSALERVQVFYDGHNVPRVTSTTVYVWNAGKRPIIANDLLDDGSLVLNLRDENADSKILALALRKTSRPSIGFNATQIDKVTASIQFQFLDALDGARFDVLHTGSANAKVMLSGAILGAPRGFREISPSPVSRASSPEGAEPRNESTPGRRARALAIKVALSLFLISLPFLLWQLYRPGDPPVLKYVEIPADLLVELDKYRDTEFWEVTFGKSAEAHRQPQVAHWIPWFIVGFVSTLSLVLVFSIWKPEHPVPFSLTSDS